MFRRPEALAVCPPGGDPRERGMFLNQTANYGLSQWEATDRILMEDFNSDNSKIDAALAGLDTRAAALEAAAGGFGNCQIYTTSYTGTGGSDASGACSLTFPKPPLLVVVAGEDCFGVCLGQGRMSAVFMMSTVFCTTNWSADGKTVSWYRNNASDQMNAGGQLYRVTAVMATTA